MALTDSQIFKELVNENTLPTWPIETYIANDTLVKAGLIIAALIVITVLMIRVTQPEK